MAHPMARAPHMDELSRTFLLILKTWCLIKQFSLVVKQYPRPVNQVLTRIWRPTVPIPEALMDELRAQLERVVDLHERDCEEKCDGVFLYGLLEKKYKNASKELTFIPESKERRRYHILNPQWANTRFATTAF